MNFELPPNNPIFKKKGQVVYSCDYSWKYTFVKRVTFLSLLIENLTGYPYFLIIILYNTLSFMRLSEIPTPARLTLTV